MKARERDALASLRFDAVPTEQTLWGGQLKHVPELNQTVYDRVREEIWALNKPTVDSPVGMVVHGEYGSGKSHLVWWARKFIAGIGGYYFNIQPDGSAQTLWSRVVDSILRDLHEPLSMHQMPPDPTTQLSLVVERLAGRLKLPEATRAVLCGRTTVEPAQARVHLKAFTDGIRSLHPSRDLRNVALALALLALRDDEAPMAGWAFLKDEPDELDVRREWGLRPVRPGPPQDVVRHLSTLLAMTGPALFVVDQIDDMVTTSAKMTEHAALDEGSTDLAAALMTIREKLTRSITLISCLDHTWQLIRKRSVRSALDRFRDGLHLEPIPSPSIACDLMVNLLAPQYDDIGFAAPYPTWPVPPEAFDRAVGLRPRQLIQRFDTYVRACRAADELLPPPDFSATDPQEESPQSDSSPTQLRFLDHRRAIVLSGLKETRAEKDLGEVLTAAVRALAVETGFTGEVTVRDVGRGAENPSVHCEIVSPAGETLFLRGINTVKASAVGSRVDKALAVAYADPGQAAHLFIARTDLWGETPRIQKATASILDADGIIVDIDDDELRTLRAVQLTTTDGSAEVGDWLRQHRPVSATALGKAVLHRITPPETSVTGEATPAATGTDSSVQPGDDRPVAPGPVNPEAIPLGRDAEDKIVEIDLHALRKHVAMFASSGSGKTVLLRRIIEECASRGVSTIVLDPNNDLARLGDAWPSPPDGWWAGDDERARDYLESTDVVVWTPGVSKGNPLTLQALPDFSAVRDDPDELRLAVDTAVASLAPRARIDGESHTADGRRAILRETLMVFARDGGETLDQLIELLLDPVDEVLALPSAAKHAGYVASALSYAKTNDPLFDGEGTGFDPDRLLTPADGYRARVSVINLAGIPEENRPAFINRLQMTLFSWIKRHPARDKPLSGLFVMDEAQTFIPSGRKTPCTESTRNLASQARKYGLGLVYATQAPRGIDSNITGNAASHVYGRVTVPAHVSAVNEMVGSRGEKPPKIARLTSGRFFISLEGRPLAETTVPMCLSHHGSPLEETEIAERARAKR